MNEEERDKHDTAIHEAAHAVGFWVLKEVLIGVDIWRDPEGTNNYNPWGGATKGACVNNPENGVTVGLMGAVANLYEEFGEDDGDDCLEYYMDWLKGGLSETDKKMIGRDFTQADVEKALEIVSNNWEAINEVAATLLKISSINWLPVEEAVTTPR